MHFEQSLEITTTRPNLALRRLPVMLAALFGLGLVFVAGFAENQLVHSAAHDTRHAAGFPCH